MFVKFLVVWALSSLVFYTVRRFRKTRSRSYQRAQTSDRVGVYYRKGTDLKLDLKGHDFMTALFRGLLFSVVVMIVVITITA